MFPVLDFMTGREISRMRRHPSPTVAWHALDDESYSFPFSIVLVMLLALLAVQLYRYVLFIPSWFKDPLGVKRQAARLTQMHERYRVSVEKFAKVVHRYRSLQAQLKERDEQLHRQTRGIDATAEALDELQCEVAQLREDNRRLAAANERLHAEKSSLEQRSLEQYYEHARQLHDREREQEGLERVIELLEADKEAAKTAFDTFGKAHENLKLHVMDLEDDLAHQHETNRQAESALEEAVRCNEHLLQQLHEQEADQGRQTDLVTEHLAATEADYHDALEQARRETEALREQLARQHEDHVVQQEALTEQIALAKADRRDIKAKLRKARDDLRFKSTDIARLESQAERYQHRYEEQCGSFREDLHFVHTESKLERDMFEGQLSSANAQSDTLRKQLADCVKRYEEQSARLGAAQASLRDASTNHTQLKLKLKAAAAEKQVADNLENMLNDALRKEQDKYETLEISFDVLESAYSFLARELVRTEHALEDALKAQQQLHERTQMYEELTESEYAEDSQTSASVFSDDRSWPATPGLTRSWHSATTSVSSPVVTTPPLPPLFLEPISSTDSGLSKHLPPLSNPDDIFGSWSLESVPLVSPT